MTDQDLLDFAIKKLSLKTIGELCGVTPAAVCLWRKRGRMPPSEYTGKTNYAERIAEKLREQTDWDGSYTEFLFNNDISSKLTKELLKPHKKHSKPRKKVCL